MSGDLDPVLALCERSAGSETPFRIIHRFEHGVGGTSLVETPDRTAVLKAWFAGGDSDTRALDRSLGLMSSLRRRGLPIPALLTRGSRDGIHYLLYEYIDGRWPERMTERTVADLFDIVDAERDAAPNPKDRWAEDLWKMLTEGDAFFDIEPRTVRRHDGGARVLEEARARLATCDPQHLRSSDIVHGDFAPENLLVRDDTVVGVVDWERCRTGDAGIDLVGALFDMQIGDKVDGPAERMLWEGIQQRVPADALAAYTGVYAVRYLSWALGTEMQDDVLALALGLLERTRWT